MNTRKIMDNARAALADTRTPADVAVDGAIDRLGNAVGEAAHTPGPWRATTLHGATTHEPWMVWADGPNAAIAHVFQRSEAGSGNNVQQCANARLIAAAPDLLAACKEVVRWYTDVCCGPGNTAPDKYWIPGALLAREAVARAEGGGK